MICLAETEISSGRSGVLKDLFMSMIYISAFTFGGGLVIITFMKKRFADDLGWLDEREMLDITAIAQSAPGLIAVNASIIIGWRMAGVLGMFVGVLGTVIPPMAIIIALSFIYDAFVTDPYVALALQGMQAGVAAIILDAAYALGRSVLSKPSPLKIAVIIGAFAATMIFKVNMVIVLLAAALIGAADLIIQKRAGTVR